MSPSRADHASLERIAPLVRRTVRAILGSDSEIHDVMNDAYVRIMEGMPRLREHDRIDKWAVRVTINTVYNVLRKRRYRRFASWDPATEPDVVVAHTDFDASTVGRHVSRIMEQMPENERALLVLRWFHGASTEDVAHHLDCSTRTAKRRMQRALRRFENYVRRDREIVAWLEDNRLPLKLRARQVAPPGPRASASSAPPASREHGGEREQEESAEAVRSVAT